MKPAFAENKEDGHATYLPYPNEQAMVDDRAFYDTPRKLTGSESFRLLNGDWRFHFIPNRRTPD